MLTMMVVETGLKEEDLFVKLVLRGRHADIDYYLSVDTYDWESGVVAFTRLDCVPAQGFKVGVAGSKLLVSATYWNEVAGWLGEWGVSFTIAEKRLFNSPQEGKAIFVELRASDLVAVRDREAAGIRAQAVIVQASRAADDEIFARE